MSHIPKLRHHKSTGRGYVVLDGHYHYLGKFSDPKTRIEYERLISQWLANGRRIVEPNAPLSIAELVELYQSAGKATDGRDKRAFKHLLAIYSNTDSKTFTRSQLKVVRSRMIEANWTRQDINLCVHRLKRLFAWAADEELIPDDVVTGLARLRGLVEGEAKREGKEVGPVDEVVFRKTLKYLSAPLRAVAELQWLTGARSMELLQLTPWMIDQTTDPWACLITKHKTAKKKVKRVLYFGKKAQLIITPWLQRPMDCRCFRPSDNRPDFNDHYTADRYAQAVARACKKAGVEHWHPHQLRYTRAFLTRRDFGLDAAQALLGHKHTSMTEHYSGVPHEKAAEAARKAG